MKSNFKLSALAICVMLVTQGCGEGGSSNAGSDYGVDTDQGSGGDNTSGGNTGGNNSGGSNGGGQVDGYSNTQLLASIIDNVIVPTYQSFQAQTGSQKQSIEDYCSALVATDGVDAARLAAQDDWKQLASIWQQAEMMQVGPLTTNNYVLRNSIYSWPVVSRCGVDQDVMYFKQGNVNGTPYQITQRTDTRRGIDALEHLLFSTNLAHNCSSTSSLLLDWQALSEQEQLQARCQFAIEVATDLQTNATTLVNAWGGNDGFAVELKAAGEVGSDYETALKGVNAISDAMFYIDSVTKDAKLAKPLGIQDNNCNGDVCLEQVESSISGYSVQNLFANIQGFSKLFYGSSTGLPDDNATGFDDFLKDVGDEQTAIDIGENLQNASDLAAAIDQPLTDLLVENPEKAQELHSGIKSVTDKLKSDFINSLALELPQTSAGDND